MQILPVTKSKKAFISATFFSSSQGLHARSGGAQKQNSAGKKSENGCRIYYFWFF
jgi:hypothetical protein